VNDDASTYPVRVHDGEQWHEFDASAGANLRRLLLRHDLSPYTRWTKHVHCGGRGLCATCGVRIVEAPAPTHWHDQLAARYGDPRLSCRVTIDRPLTVCLLPDKRVWGVRRSSPRG
jgi:ferredoxin